MYDKLKHYFLLPFNTRTLFMHFQWPVVYCFIVDENIHCINISGMYVCKISKMYKQINNDIKNNDDDDDDDHNILLYVGLKNFIFEYIVIVPITTVFSAV